VKELNKLFDYYRRRSRSSGSFWG